MLYTEFINKAIDATISQADNGTYYLEPLWRNILHDNALFFDKVSDFEAEPDIVANVLHLEVEKRNAIYSNKNFVIDWLHDLITDTLEPAMLDGENELYKTLTEYLKSKNNKLVNDEDWNNFTKI